jgi:hypothetical protein
LPRLFLVKLDHVVNPHDGNGGFRGKLQREMCEVCDGSQTQRVTRKLTSVCTNLDNLYFAHRWLNHAVFKVVADYAFRQVKTHAAAKIGTSWSVCSGRTKTRTVDEK